jgi:hypothetical protein
MSAETPPVTKYELTIVLHGNSHDELVSELLSMTRGGYLLDSGYYKRDELHVVGGNGTRVLRHTNPEMTPERYAAELDAWWTARKAAR